MCTTAAKKINNSWVLIKTRDPVEWMRWDDEITLFDTPADKYRKWLIHNPDMHQDGYYGGMNEQGVAIVATYVQVAENQISYIRRPYVRLILDAATAKEAIEIVKSFSPHIGGNIFIADAKECYGIEATPTEYYTEKIEHWGVKTNHFQMLPNRNLAFDKFPKFEAWSKTHYERASELVEKAKTVDDMQAVLSDREHAKDAQAICTTTDEDECCTHSAFVFDTANKVVRYAQGNPAEVEFKTFDFSKK